MHSSRNTAATVFGSRIPRCRIFTRNHGLDPAELLAPFDFWVGCKLMGRMAKLTQGARGQRGIPGPPGPRGSAGATGHSGARGAKGAKGARGPKTRPPGLKGRQRLLLSVERHIENIYGELTVQMQRLAKLQAQVDELRAKIRRV